MNPVLRRLLHAWFRVSRGLTLGVRGIVVGADGRVLLVRHTYLPGWHLPGGGVEVGETALAALGRELSEEAGIVLTGPAELRGICFNGHVSRRDHVLVFLVRDFDRSAGWAPNREIAAAAFFAPDALPDDAATGTRERIREVARDVPPPARWT